MGGGILDKYIYNTITSYSIYLKSDMYAFLIQYSISWDPYLYNIVI